MSSSTVQETRLSWTREQSVADFSDFILKQRETPTVSSVFTIEKLEDLPMDAQTEVQTPPLTFRVAYGVFTCLWIISLAVLVLALSNLISLSGFVGVVGFVSAFGLASVVKRINDEIRTNGSVR